MKAKKENKVYVINTDQEKQRYLKDGYDIYDDDGNVLEYSPRKKIAFSEYMKAVKEIERLQAQIAALEDTKEKPEKDSERKTASKKAGE